MGPWDHVEPEIKARINNFVHTYLKEDYVAYPQEQKVRAPKIIHTSPWGTHRYKRWEIDLIDTPLLQRLRQIHQTAGSLFTFPSCTHSRFEHTLGVVHQSSRLFDAVIRRAKEDDPDSPLANENPDKVRAAAILHDCGHGPFSHSTEEVYSYCEDMLALTDSDGPFPSKNPHEILGSLIVMSEPFREFWNRLDKKYGMNVPPEWIARTIIGSPAERGNKYLSQIVNGPFDADKLDYIFRDGSFMGIPQVVDLDRLWYGATISKRKLPRHYPGDWERILALDRGAASPLEQIVFFKFMLFQTLYHHHKVRAVDCMIKGVIEYITKKGIKFSLGDGKNLTLKNATDFLWLTDETFYALAYASSSYEIHRMIHNIRYRRLFKRALVICRDTLEEDSQPMLLDICRLARKGDVTVHWECRNIANEIWKRAGKPCSKHEVWLDIPYPPSGKESSDCYVRCPQPGNSQGNRLEPVSRFFPADRWAEMYSLFKWRAHVFCPAHCVQEVSKHAKGVMEGQFRIKLNPSSRALCHIS